MKAPSKDADGAPTGAAEVSPEENRRLFDSFYALFASSIRFAAAFDTIPEALKKRTASGDVNASAALRALMRLNMKSGDSVKVSDLARITGVSFGWGSRLVDDLEAMDLVERVRDTADRRVVHVRLTKSGATLCKGMYDNRQKPFAEALAKLNAAERGVAITFLGDLTDAFDKAAKKG